MLFKITNISHHQSYTLQQLIGNRHRLFQYHPIKCQEKLRFGTLILFCSAVLNSTMHHQIYSTITFFIICYPFPALPAIKITRLRFAFGSCYFSNSQDASKFFFRVWIDHIWRCCFCDRESITYFPHAIALLSFRHVNLSMHSSMSLLLCSICHENGCKPVDAELDLISL